MPQAIALPQLRPELKKVVRYPAAAPTIPPTITDVAEAIKLTHEMYFARQRLDANDEELVNVWKYQTALLASDEEPAWFAAAMTRVLAPIQEELVHLREGLQAVAMRISTAPPNDHHQNDI